MSSTTLLQNDGLPSHPKYRADIDGLRAIAILSVIAFHAFPTLLKGGFAGVDVFFVISGYLISHIIFSGLDKGSFSFAEFYSRRIRRIFPSLVVVLAACYILGWFTLFSGEYKQLGKHIAGGAGFLSNFILWDESGYFDGMAETKPLLHLWSLGVEEQFYIVWPLMLYLAWKRHINLLLLILLVLVCSFSFNAIMVRHDVISDFYSPVTRFWELLIGSYLAYTTLYKQNLFSGAKNLFNGESGQVTRMTPLPVARPTSDNIKSAVGFILVAVAVLVLDKDKMFPGWWAILPVIGAYLLISAGPEAWLNRKVLSHKVMVWIGLISFPLYLWHWPLLSFAAMIEKNILLSPEIRIAVVFGSFLLAGLTYQFVEKPIRFGRYGRVKVVILCLLMLAIGVAGYNAFKQEGLGFRAAAKAYDPIRAHLRSGYQIRSQYQLTSCANDPRITARATAFCKGFNIRPGGRLIVLWGDSHARAWSPVFFQIARERGFGVIMFTHPGCPPLLHVRRSDELGNSKFCSEFGTGESVLQSIENLKPDMVFLSARWGLYANGWIVGGIHKKESHFVTAEADGDADIESSRKAMSTQLVPTLDALRKTTNSVVILKDIPVLKQSISSGYYRNPDSFEVTMDEHQKHEEFNDKLIDEAAARMNIQVINPAQTLCEDKCKAIYNGTIMYIDDNHISAGGTMVFKESIGEIITANLATSDLPQPVLDMAH